jgi:hypothetical protein
MVRRWLQHHLLIPLLAAWVKLFPKLEKFWYFSTSFSTDSVPSLEYIEFQLT